MSLLAAPAITRFGSITVTDGIAVRVDPEHLPEHSDPWTQKRIFRYAVQIENHTDEPVQLLRRRWLLIDAHGRQDRVTGRGVVGQQPRIGPGDEFSYASWCRIPTKWGTMEGGFTMLRDDQGEFEARVGRLYLVTDETS